MIFFENSFVTVSVFVAIWCSMLIFRDFRESFQKTEKYGDLQSFFANFAKSVQIPLKFPKPNKLFITYSFFNSRLSAGAIFMKDTGGLRWAKSCASGMIGLIQESRGTPQRTKAKKSEWTELVQKRQSSSIFGQERICLRNLCSSECPLLRGSSKNGRVHMPGSDVFYSDGRVLSPGSLIQGIATYLSEKVNDFPAVRSERWNGSCRVVNKSLYYSDFVIDTAEKEPFKRWCFIVCFFFSPDRPSRTHAKMESSICR